MRVNFRPSVRAIDWPSEVLPTPGGPTKQRIGPTDVALQLRDGEVLDDPFLHLVEVEVVLVEDAPRLLEVEVVLGHLVPRQRDDPVQVRADDAVLGRRRGQLLQPGELALRCLADILGQLQLGELRAELVHLGLLLVALAELLLDRLQLLAQEVLALALLHLRLDLRLDLRAELDHLELAAEDRRDRPEALLDVCGLEQLLFLPRLQAHGRCDEVGEDGRVVDVRRRELQLLGQVRDRRDDARELVLDVARQRLQLFRLLDDLGDIDELADEVRLLLHPTVEPDPLHALDEDPQRAVRDPDQLVHDRGRADLVQVVPARRLDVLVAHSDEGEHPVAGGNLVDQCDRALLADRERCHRLREDHRLFQRENGKGRGNLDLLLVDDEFLLELAHCSPRLSPSTIKTRPTAGFRASGITIVS